MKYIVGVLLCLGLGQAFAVSVEGMVISDEGYLWPNGVIPYVFDEAISSAQQQEALNAFDLWQGQTNVRFVPRTPGNEAQYPNYVVFIQTTGKTCASSVGMQGGMQVLKLAPRCHEMAIAHELGHLLGLWHEQGRLDRDSYVEVLWDNIWEDHQKNFRIHVNDGQNTGSYDYDSIMHYSAYAFSKNGKPTLKVLDNSVKIGQRTHLSLGDIEVVNTLYKNEVK